MRHNSCRDRDMKMEITARGITIARPQALQELLDVAFPAMQSRVRDGDSPASLLRIAEALRSVGSSGARPATLPVCESLTPRLDREVEDDDLAALLEAIRTLLHLLCWRRRYGDHTASASFSDNHANAMLLNQCAFRHSDLSLLLKASLKPLSVGFPGREKSRVTPLA